MSNSIQLAPQADSVLLTSGLQSLQQSLFAAAEQNINTALGDQANAFSALSRRAMVVTEALRLTSGMDLSTIIMRVPLLNLQRELALLSMPYKASAWSLVMAVTIQASSSSSGSSGWKMG